MDIFFLIDRYSKNECVMADAVYLPKGKWLRLGTEAALDLANLKENFGEKLKIDFCFAGKLLVKYGVSASAHSFKWLGDRLLSANGIDTQQINIDLANIKNGRLEITLLSIDETAIFNNAPIAEKINLDERAVLYQFISPTLDLCCEEPLYYKFWGEFPYYSFEDKTVHLHEDEALDLLTYFNAFSAMKWLKYTNVRNLSIFVDFQGHAVAHLVNLTANGQQVIMQWRLDSSKRCTMALPLGNYLNNGILGLRIHALADCILYGGGYATADPPTQSINLGICITTFKREADVKKSVARLVAARNRHPLLKDSIVIIVVDNGQTLQPEDLPGARLIPNRNLGGTGGFMRGLYHCKKDGRITHCLFMDDDAACEPEAIIRGISFLSHAIDPALSLSGAMLYENIQFKQWENGAWFDGGCHSLKRDLDLREPDNLFKNEAEPDKPIYGAWWFFMFPIACVEHFSFPYFVRGDDIDFSYSNKFLITSLNGIASWQEDFKTKESPLTVYLFVRSHILHHMNLACLDQDFKKVRKMVTKHFSTYNSSYLYGTAAAVNLAIKHVLAGPDFWQTNMEPKIIFKQIAKFAENEKYVPLNGDEKTRYKMPQNKKTKIWPYFIRKYSLNGHLLPAGMIEKSVDEYLPKYKVPAQNHVYMRDKMVVIDDVRQAKTILKRDPKKYFHNYFEFSSLIKKLEKRFNKLAREYQSASENYREENFWDSNF